MSRVRSQGRERRTLITLFLVALGWLGGPGVAMGQEGPRIIAIPYAPNNLDLPWPVHQYARITLKAVMRDAPCADGYAVAWDVDRDGDYDDETSRTVFPAPGTDTVYDLGRTFEVPEVDQGQTLTINVRAISECDINEESFGTFRMFVYNWTPSSDPTKWTQDQVDIMSTMAVHESLWWMHRQVGDHSGSGGAIQGSLPHLKGDRYRAASDLAFLWGLTANGRLPAYPPGGINDYGRALPEGWHEANDKRWEEDPYSETAARVMNWAINRYVGAYLIEDANIGVADEDNTCGWNEDGSERRCQRIADTTNSGGSFVGWDSGVYMQGMGLGALATTLPALAGTPLQVGRDPSHPFVTVRGRPFEWYVQEMVDWLGYTQHDSGCSLGGWLYANNQDPTTCNRMDASTSQWAYIGLESAEVAGGPYGVIVSNRHKYRIANNLIENQSHHGASSYRTSNRGSARHDFHLTGGAIVAARWLGIHNMEPSDERPFAPYSNYTAQEMVNNYTRYLEYIAQYWNTPGMRGIHWQGGLWDTGHYLCGSPQGVYNAPKCGYSYAMYSHQKGYRTGQPELTLIGGHDWAREFNIYYMRSQERHLDDYPSFGRNNDERWAGGYRSVTVDYAFWELTNAWSALVMTPTLFKPKPVALANIQPNEVFEGCRGANNGQVSLDHRESFHPNRDRVIAEYQWDVDASDGLWWETGAPADYRTDNGDSLIAHTYQTAGVYVATMRVVDDDPDGVQTEQTTVTVNVRQSPPASPAALAGGPYVIEDTQSLTLRGSATDPNVACGDVLTAVWDLDNDGQYDDAAGFEPTVSAASLASLPREVAHTIRLRVTDATGRVAVAEGALTIYPREPVAVASVNPQPAECLHPVRFDAVDSYHPNPARRVERYQWDVHPDPGFEGDGANTDFTYTYNRFDTFPGRLVITDDRGRTDTVFFDVAVTEGNRSPIAETTEGVYTVTDGSSVTLDGTPSREPDLACGDTIVEYAWDIDNNGSFDDAGDLRGARITLPWARLEQMAWPADRATGEPTNIINLRVTDTQGASHVTQTGVRIYQTRPVPLVFQSPDPGAILALTAESRITLDGRASYSPVPGVEIVEFDWDLNDDGVFEVQNQPTPELVRVFEPIPDEAPLVFVRLRVRDDEGRANTVRAQVLISLPGQTPPTAIAHPDERVGGGNVGGPINGEGGGYHLFAGELAELDASASFEPDPGDAIVFYRWDLDDDGEWDLELADEDGDGAEAIVEVSPELMAQVGWDEPGTFTVLLQVEDATGRVNTAVTEATLYDPPPIAAGEINPNPAECNGLVVLDASTSSQPHPDVEVVAWSWDLTGDGRYDNAVGERITTRFGRFTFDGPLTLGLRVEDSAGHASTVDFELLVTDGNRPPVADAGGPYAVAQGDDVRLDARGSREPDTACGDSIAVYRWDLNRDGVYDVEGRRPEVTSATLAGVGMGQAGQYTITLQTEDRFGRTSTDDARLWISGPPTAVAQASQASAGCNEQVRFNGAASFISGPEDRGFDIEEYLWDMDGDGVFERSGVEISHPLVSRAEVTATLMVVDGRGRTSLDTVTVGVDIANVRPVADAGGPYVTVRIDGDFVPVDLDARASFEPNAPCDAIQAYAWDTDNDGLYGADDVNGAGVLVGSDYVGEVVRDYVSPTWQTGTTQVVRVRAQDAFGEWSAPAEGEVRVRIKLPPSGELVFPRGGDCLPDEAGPFVVSLQQPQGGRVTAVARVDGILVGGAEVELPEDGSAVQVEIPVNYDQAAEGHRTVTITATNDEGESSIINAGGAVTFDRTEPVIGVNPMLVDGACYAENAVPEILAVVVDTLDPAPQQVQILEEDSCQRTLTVTATDACGNEATLERSWLLAEEVPYALEGPANGEVLQEASFTWAVDAPAACVGGQEASVRVGNGAELAYTEGTVLALPGQYRFELDLFNCRGGRYGTQRTFQINNPPIAVAGGPYTGAEGREILLNGSQSRGPEVEDEVVLWEWDMNLDGVYELVGEEVAYVPVDSGAIVGNLRVTDSFGSSSITEVPVTVLEVSPVVSAGGPYAGFQGGEIEFDARATRPGSQADLITAYEWDFGDGSEPARGAQLTQPAHRYEQNGVYTVRLTVFDEDGSASVLVPVEIRDAQPQVSDIAFPEDVYEAEMWTFSVEASAGEEGDPLQSITWDFGDGSEPVSGADLNEVQYSWRDAGVYTVTVTVGDTDSVAVDTQEIIVRPISLAEALQLVGSRAAATDDGPLVASVLGSLDPLIDLGLWGEANLQRGNTLVAIERVVGVLVTAQSLGADLGDTLWVLMRQVLREVEGMRALMVEPPVGEPQVSAEHPSVVRADSFIDNARSIFDDAQFEARVSGGLEALVANDMFASLFEGYFYLRDSVDPCKDARFNGFAIDDAEDLVERVESAQPTNELLGEAMAGLAVELQAYAEVALDAPGRDRIMQALVTLRDIQRRLAFPVALECEEGDCLSDNDALVLTLDLMDLSTGMNGANAEGVYVRNWQACLVEGVKFRTGLSQMRLEHICGPNHPVTQRVLTARNIGLTLVEENNDVVSALNYFHARPTRCLTIWAYNECLVPAFPADNPEHPTPEFCQEIFEQEPGDGEPVGD